MERIKELAEDFLTKHDGNIYSRDGFAALYVCIFQSNVGVESIWYAKDEDKVYLHCGCMEFEGDIDIESLSDENQKHIMDYLKA